MSTARARSGDTYTTRAPHVDVLPGLVGPVQGVDGYQEARQGLTRAGRGRDQGVRARRE